MHFRNVTVSFNQAINVIISEIGQKAKLNANQLAEVRHAATKAINNAVETSTENTKKDLQNLVDEYSASLKGKAA
jgi:formate dehydrogenase maturation protein FdhE